MLRPFSALLVVPFLAAATIVACSSSDDNTGGSSSGTSGTSGTSGSSGSSGTSGTSGSSGGTDAGADAADAAPSFVNDCKTFADRSATGDTRILTWDFAIATSATDRCITVKKGQTVTWNGDFNTHPLGALGGDTPNPIAGVGSAGTVTFDATGTFGWHCEVHPSMIGAVQVIE